MTYKFKTNPMPHQLDEFEYSKDFTARGLWWDMGSGKSKAMVDNIAYLFGKDEADAAIIIAPGGVHLNWTEDCGEIKCQWNTHTPDIVRVHSECYTYNSGSGGKKWERKARSFLTSNKKKVLSLTYEGLSTKNGQKFVNYLLDTHRCIVVVDECHKIKNPDAKRTKAVLNLAGRAKYRRVLTGTLIAQSMFDCFAPIKFLEPDYWDQHHIGKFYTFKHYFGEWKSFKNYKNMRPRKVNGQIKMVPVEYQTLVDYKRKDELRWHVEKNGSRVRKSDVLKDLPTHTYQKLSVPLSKEQKRLYTTMEKEFYAELDSGEMVETQHAMTRIQKMHQILQGFLIDEMGEYHRIKQNPRMDMLMDICDSTEEQVLIWTPFPSDIIEIERKLKEKGKQVVSYYGGTEKGEERPKNKEAYQTGKVQFFVSNQAVGGTGIELTNTGVMIYYGHSYSLTERKQSEERVSRPGLKNNWQKIDMISKDTFEPRIMEAVNKKQNVAMYIMNDHKGQDDGEG